MKLILILINFRDKSFSESASEEDELEFEKQKNNISQQILDMPDKELFMIEFVDMDIPDEAHNIPFT